uniref:Uncharacterized protein n=1 Tax=Gasterosteus aculeatus TaxID=69293 RepID=G3NY49_GASAC
SGNPPEKRFKNKRKGNRGRTFSQNGCTNNPNTEVFTLILSQYSLKVLFVYKQLGGAHEAVAFSMIK